MALTTYVNDRDRWTFLADSYWGGSRYRNPSSAKLGTARTYNRALLDNGQQVASVRREFRSYLLPHQNETDLDFEGRIAIAAHVPIVAPIVKAYAESVTSNVRRALPGLAGLEQDATLRGSAWSELVEEAARWFALYGLGFGVIDAPLVDAAPVTAADDAALGIRPYAILVHAPAVALCETDRDGRIVHFAYADEPYYDRDGRGNYEVCLREFGTTLWMGAPGWRRLRGQVASGADIGSVLGGFAVEAEGPLPPRLGGELPIVPGFYDRDSSSTVPRGISLIDDAADCERLIYNSLSWATEIHRRAGFPFLAVPLKSTGGQMDNKTELTIGPGYGLPYDSSTGAPNYVQPSSESTKELREHCGWLFQIALRSAGLEVAADASAQVQSGEALRIRSRDFESRAKRFASSMRAWELRMLRLAALYAGVADKEIDVTYPVRFTLPDPTADLERALKMLGAPIETGPTAKRLAAMQVVDAALVLNDSQRTEVDAQIGAIMDADVAAIDAQRAADAELRAAQSAAIRVAAPQPNGAGVAEP